MTAEARAKLLLFGEHAAVYGHPAVGVSLPWPLTVAWEASAEWELPGLGAHTAAVRGLLTKLEDQARAEGLPVPRPGRLTFATGIPVGSGFGSSGALCAALVNLFHPHLPLTDRDRLAWQAESVFHGTPSGIDTALALRTGWWVLDASTRPVTATALADPRLSLVVGAVVRSSDTKRLVGELARRRAAGDPLVVSTLDELGGLAKDAALAVGGGGEGLPALTRRAREGLQRLDLETPELTAVLDAGLHLPGALGGKLSGAGGGGAFWLQFASPAEAEAALVPLRRCLADDRWTAAPRSFSWGR